MSFDLDSLMEATITESNSTSLKPLPADDLPGVIDKVKLSQGEKDGKTWVRMDVIYDVTCPAACEATGLEEPKALQAVFLDINPNGTLDNAEGKNIGLGRLREATGLNVPGQPFNFSMLEGKPVVVKIKNEPNKSDPQGGLRSVVAAVAART